MSSQRTKSLLNNPRLALLVTLFLASQFSNLAPTDAEQCSEQFKPTSSTETENKPNIGFAGIETPDGQLAFISSRGDFSNTDRFAAYPPLLLNAKSFGNEKQPLELITFTITGNHLKEHYNNAYLYYRLIDGGSLLSLDMVKVAPPWKGKRISQLLIGRMLERNPGATKVHFLLDGDNAQIFRRNRSLGIDKALEETPAYKTLSKFGFGRITFIREFRSPGGQTLEVVLEK